MDNSGALIRPATDDDAPSVRTLAGLLATTFQIDNDAFDRAFFRIKEDEKARILVAVDHFGQLIGYLLGFVHDAFFANGAVAWIEERYVSETARRGGVGSALERDFDAWARSRQAKLVALATRRAASFYKALGYEESAVYFRRTLQD